MKHILLIFKLVLIGLGLITLLLFLKVGLNLDSYQNKNRNQNRSAAVAEIGETLTNQIHQRAQVATASTIATATAQTNMFAVKNQENTLLDNTVLPLKTFVMLPVGIFQIGTATDGCALETAACKITVDACLGLFPTVHTLESSKPKTYPSDPLYGSQLKSGYALQYQETGELSVIACHAELDEHISFKYDFEP